MLTGMVNIAVFAAFACCITGDLLSNRQFKAVCAASERDVSRYGRQRWQDRGKKRQRSGKVGGKNGKDGQGCGGIHAGARAAAMG